MKLTHPVVWMGAAALAAAFSIPMLMRHEPEVAADKPADQNYFSFVRSLDGTRPDGNVKTTGDDALVVDASLVQLFDYYLATVGEKPLDVIRQQIEKELDQRLKPGAAAQAKNLLGRYIDYKTALVEVEKNPQATGNSLAAIRARMEAMHQTRARFFSDAESNALFGLDDARDVDAVARMEVMQDKSLNDAQKKEKLAALDAALPQQLREARELPLQIVKLQEQAEQMRAKGASDDDIYRMRATALSPEAAARMADVDREETRWKQRIASYLSARASLSDAAAIAELRNRMFDAQEQLRLPAYEK
ncbi:MAG TPA: lipase secretion chaperone [Noviherbaspirillum sp.]|nr:lipase secretion chaperone [Noviherbaspirillum sp.]